MTSCFRNSALGLLLLLVASVFVFASCGEDTTTTVTGPTVYVPTPTGTRTFEDVILPLFNNTGVFEAGSMSCAAAGCHDSAVGAHELDMTSYIGVVAGADLTRADGGVSILGQSVKGTGAFAAGYSCLAIDGTASPTTVAEAEACLTASPASWGSSKLKGRLRNNRMPPGWPMDLSEANRSTPEILVTGAWIAQGSLSLPLGAVGGAASIPGTSTIIAYDTVLSDIVNMVLVDTANVADADTFETSGNCTAGVVGTVTTTCTAPADWTAATTNTVGGLFDTAGAFTPLGAACSSCHNGLAGAHEMEMGTYVGIVSGADLTRADGGVSILGQSVKGTAGAYVDGYSCNAKDDGAGSPTTDIEAEACLAASAGDWGASKMKGRLRNNRMPIGMSYDPSEANRDSFAITLIGMWVAEGAPSWKDQ